MPLQNPSALQILTMASMAPLNSGFPPPIPTTWSFRRITSNGCVNRSEVPPARPPHASWRKTSSGPSSVLFGGKTYALTRPVSKVVRNQVLMPRTSFVDVEIERNIRCDAHCSRPATTTTMSARSTTYTTGWRKDRNQNSLQAFESTLGPVDLFGHPYHAEFGIFC